MQQSKNLSTRDFSNWEGMLRGDEEAYAKLYEDYFKILYNYGKKICSDTTKVEDGIHDLFVDLWRFRANLSTTTSVRFYLYRSLRRRLIKENFNPLSISGQGFILEEALQLASPSLENEIVESESKNQQIHQLKKLLSDLSPRQYEALVLFFYDEFSYKEIGAILHVNEQSARNLVQRGLVQLRQYAKLIVSFSLFLLSVF